MSAGKHLWHRARAAYTEAIARLRSDPAPPSRPPPIFKLRKGDTYRTSTEVRIVWVAPFGFPFTGGGHATLPTGEELRIEEDVEASSTKPILARPVRYEELHHSIVDAETREIRGYQGYWLYVDYEALLGEFVCVSAGNAKRGHNPPMRWTGREGPA